MKITIDTKEDSPEAIRKAIELLSHALGESPKPGFQNIFSNAQEASAEPSLQEPTNAFFGSLLVGLTFMFKGNLIKTAMLLQPVHIILILVSTVFILFCEIYFIGYSRVPNKKERPFGQFFGKRFTALYGITLIVSLYLIYIFGIYLQLEQGWYGIFKMLVLVSMPCSIGSAVPSLMKQF